MVSDAKIRRLIALSIIIVIVLISIIYFFIYYFKTEEGNNNVGNGNVKKNYKDNSNYNDKNNKNNKNNKNDKNNNNNNNDNNNNNKMCTQTESFEDKEDGFSKVKSYFLKFSMCLLSTATVIDALKYSSYISFSLSMLGIGAIGGFLFRYFIHNYHREFLHPYENYAYY